MTLATPIRDGVRLSRPDRQAQIFDAAMALFEQSGYDAVTVEEICLAGRIGRATFFRVFGGKAGLIEEANRRTADRIRRRVEVAERRGPDALILMGRVIGQAWLDAGGPIYAMFEATMGGRQAAATAGQPTGDAAREGSLALADLAIRYVAQGQADGEFRQDVDAEAMGLSFMSLLLTACSLWVSRDGRDPLAFPRRVDQAVSVMVAGLRLERPHAIEAQP